MEDFEILLNQFCVFAGGLCDEIHRFQPDLVIGLMHSGWMPLFAGMELWKRVENGAFPPVVCVNIGTEKLGRFNKTENPYGVTQYFVGEHEGDESIAFFLNWLSEQKDWIDEFQSMIREQIGERFPERILLVDEFVFEGATSMMSLGMLNSLYPKAQTRFLNANMEWTNSFFDEWLNRFHPEWLDREPFRRQSNVANHPKRVAGRKMILGSEDIDPESLRWQKITKESPLLETLIEYQAAEDWLSLSNWAEGIVREAIVRWAGQYVPGQATRLRTYSPLPLKLFILRNVFRDGALNTGQVASEFGLSVSRVRRELELLVDRGYLLKEVRGRVNWYTRSPRMQPGYWKKDYSALDCYWVLPGRLLVGDLPGWDMKYSEETLSPRLDWLLDQGVTFFLDLSNKYSGKPKTYQRILEEKAGEKGKAVMYRALFTPEQNLPARSQIVTILDILDEALAQGKVVYMHSIRMGGIEETIAGCYLVRHGMDGRTALHTLQDARHSADDPWWRAPRTHRGRDLVRRWRKGM